MSYEVCSLISGRKLFINDSKPEYRKYKNWPNSDSGLPKIGGSDFDHSFMIFSYVYDNSFVHFFLKGHILVMEKKHISSPICKKYEKTHCHHMYVI